MLVQLCSTRPCCQPSYTEYTHTLSSTTKPAFLVGPPQGFTPTAPAELALEPLCEPRADPRPPYPPMPAAPLASAAQLRTLTERLASSANPLDFLRDVGLPALPGPLTQKFLNQAATAAAPPALPVLQLLSRHQDPPYPSTTQDVGKGAKAVKGVNGTNGHAAHDSSAAYTAAQASCPAGIRWPEWNQHSDKRCSRCEEEELQEFEDCMALALRREFDCWVEQCWSVPSHPFRFCRPCVRARLS